jgi:hypothetical protein
MAGLMKDCSMLSKVIICTFLFSWNMVFTLVAQQDLTSDVTFFHSQKDIYQKWLTQSGLGQTLKIHKLTVEPQRLSLFLKIRHSNTDSIINAWKTIKYQFDQFHPITLEQQLFYKLSNLMGVSESLLDIQLYDTYDKDKKPVFFRGIYFENRSVQVDGYDPKSKIRELKVSAADLTRSKKLSVEEFQENFSREVIYQKILAYTKQRFEQQSCDNRYPELRQLESGDVLRFEVLDLCREVLTDEANPLLCEILRSLNYNCNWVKREWLAFTIIYEPMVQGFRLYIDIDGKFGSGFYGKVRRSGYLSMEIDFDDYLESYADTFKEDLKRMILYEKN